MGIAVLLVGLIAIMRVQTAPQVYGVRWFLGPHFRLTMPQDKPFKKDPKYILVFNSQQRIDIPLFVSIGRAQYACSYRHIDLESTNHSAQMRYNTIFEQGAFETYINFCYIDQTFQRQQNYSIVALQTEYGKVDNKTRLIGRDSVVFFSGVFRPLSQSGEYRFISLGDWGQMAQNVVKERGYVDIIDCLLKTVKEDQSIRGTLFLGDIGYDIQGSVYVSMLKYIEPLTSQMIWITAPGNHDTSYHDDSFILFTESFLTPEWKDYHNYFFTAEIGKDLVFVGYNPQMEIENFSRMIDQIRVPEVFQNQFTEQKLQYLRTNKTVVVMNHYPMFCSHVRNDQVTCDTFRNNSKLYLTYFEKMGMDLFISGHIHTYERMQPICYAKDPDEMQFQYGQQYLSVCPVYIIDGAAGNSYFVQMQQQYEHKPYSAKMVFNTGFGILTTHTDSQGDTYKLTYDHISCVDCKIVDTISINTKHAAVYNFMTVLISSVVLSLALIMILAACIWIRYNKRLLKGPAIQMVQQENH